MRTSNRVVLLLGAVAALAAAAGPGTSASVQARSGQTTQPQAASGQAPSAPAQVFEENRGQAGAPAAFVSRGGGFVVRLDPDGIDLLFDESPGGRGSSLTRLTFIGARVAPAVMGAEPLTRTVTYLARSDPGGWITGIRTFEAVRYADLYPGIDLTVRGDYRRLLLEFTLAPEADAASIALALEGTGSIEIDGDAREARRFSGAAATQFLDAGALIWDDPVPASPGGARHASLALLPSRTEEPNTRAFPGDVARIAVDGQGNTYVAGRAPAAGLGHAEAFVQRIDRDGTPRFTTYFGGAGEDVPLGITVGDDQEIVVTGRTRSEDFPLARPVQVSLSGRSDIFVAKFSADGSSLVYSTYIGGEGEDEGRAVSLDAQGVAWVAGRTEGRGFPGAPRAASAARRKGFDGFVAALAPGGWPILRAALFGGSGDDAVNAIQIDSAGRVWLAGGTASADFPHAPTARIAPGGRKPIGEGAGEAFIATLDGSDDVPTIVALIGGSGDDEATALALDALGNVYVAGSTSSADLPATAGAPQSTFGGGLDGLVAILSRDRSRASFDGRLEVRRLGYVGGEDDDVVTGIASDGRGNAWIAGWSQPAAGAEARPRTALVARVAVDEEPAARPRRGRGTLSSRHTGIAIDPDGRPIVVGFESAGVAPAGTVVEAAPAGGVIVVAPAADASIAPEAAGCPGTIQFTNGAGTGLWQTAANWDLGTLPISTDDVCIPAGMIVTLSSGAQSINTLFQDAGASLTISAGSLSIAAASQVDGPLRLSGGTLSGVGEVTVNGLLTWTSGFMTGAGTTHANGGIVFSTTAVKDITGSRVLNTAGTTTWQDTGTIRVGSGATIRNAGTWDLRSDATMTFLTATPRFVNLAGGTFQKTAGTGSTIIDVPFDNLGTVSIVTGSIDLSRGGTGSGVFLGPPGTNLLFTDSYTLDSASSLDADRVFVTGGGTLDVSGTYDVATATTVSGATARFNPAATVLGLGSASLTSGILTLNSGEAIALPTLSLSVFQSTLQGSDTVTVSGPITWNGGTMTGAGTVNANGGIVFSGSVVKDISGSRVLNTAGTMTWTNGSSIRVGSGGTIRNSGVWDAGDGTMVALGGAARFVNLAAGTFQKTTGTGSTTIDIPFDNQGTVSVATGTLNLSAGGVDSGSFSGAIGALLEFSDGTHTLDSASSIDADRVSVTSGTLDVFGTYDVATSTTVTNGTARFNPAATLVSLGSGASLGNGTLTLNSGEAVTLQALSIAVFGSVLQGSDTVTVTGPISWSGGTMTGAGTVNANGGIAFSTTTVKDISGSRLVNTSGTTTWGGGGSVRLGSGGTIRNAGIWDAADATMAALGGTARFTNLAGATFRKTSGTGSTTFDIPFDNQGTVSVATGTLNMSAGGIGSATFSGAPGTTFAFSAGYTLDGTSTFAADRVAVTSGTLDVFGTYDVTTSTTVTTATARFNPTSTVVSLGSSVSLSVGVLTLNSGEAIALQALSIAVFGSVLQGSDTVTVSGPTTWSGGTMTGTGTVNANGGITFSTTTVKDISGSRVLNTAGTTTWTSGGSVRVGSGGTIRNSGVWDAGDGTMVTLGGTARFVNLAGGTFQKTAGTGSAAINIPFDNAGAVRSLAGTLTFNAGYTQTAGSTSVEGGVVSSATALNIQGGSLGGSGTVSAGVVNAGSLAPGLSPGALAITGAYTQSATGSFDVEIGGLTPGTEHDRADLSGAVTLGGVLNGILVNGFTPADFDTFTIMTFPSATGTFASVNLPALPDDLVWRIHRNPTSIVLEVLADLDGDGVRNLSDCAPSDPTAWSIPAEVAPEAFGTNGQTLSWPSLASQAGPAITYDVVRGSVSQLPVADKPDETCLAPDTASTQATDSAVPGSGPGFYYLVRGSNVCGIGTYGTTSTGAPRVTSVCP